MRDICHDFENDPDDDDDDHANVDEFRSRDVQLFFKNKFRA